MPIQILLIELYFISSSVGKVRNSWTEDLYVWIIQIQTHTKNEWQVQLKYSRLLDPSNEACRATMLLLEIVWCVTQGKTSWNISAHLRNTQAPKRVPTVGQMGRTVGLLFTYSLQRMFQENTWTRPFHQNQHMERHLWHCTKLSRGVQTFSQLWKLLKLYQSCSMCMHKPQIHPTDMN